jgi:hypothetical protein
MQNEREKEKEREHTQTNLIGLREQEESLGASRREKKEKEELGESGTTPERFSGLACRQRSLS